MEDSARQTVIEFVEKMKGVVARDRLEQVAKLAGVDVRFCGGCEVPLEYGDTWQIGGDNRYYCKACFKVREAPEDTKESYAQLLAKALARIAELEANFNETSRWISRVEVQLAQAAEWRQAVELTTKTLRHHADRLDALEAHDLEDLTRRVTKLEQATGEPAKDDIDERVMNLEQRVDEWNELEERVDSLEAWRAAIGKASG